MCILTSNHTFEPCYMHTWAGSCAQSMNHDTASWSMSVINVTSEIDRACNVLAFVSVQGMENGRRHWKILEDAGRIPWKETESYGS